MPKFNSQLELTRCLYNFVFSIVNKLITPFYLAITSPPQPFLPCHPEISILILHLLILFITKWFLQTLPLWSYATVYFCMYPSTVYRSTWGLGCSWEYPHKIWSVPSGISTYVSESIMYSNEKIPPEDYWLLG